MNTKNIVIEIKHLYKKYDLLSSKKTDASFWALRDVNLKILQGENIGIVGANGSGKSTLLKIISGISTATKGEVATNGKIVSLMKLEAGFSLELTGSENIYINGMLVGMQISEIKQKFSEIISFSGLGKFINSPLYTYSDGMKFRLALAIALASKCDILLIDEILISGDIDFQQKTISVIREAQKSNKITTIITSHIPAFVWAFSNKYYMLEKGKLKKISTKAMHNFTKKVDQIWRKNIYDFEKYEKNIK